MTHPLVVLAAGVGNVAADSGSTVGHDVTRHPLTDLGSWNPVPTVGSQTFQHLAQGLEWWALALALVGIVVGAAVWALGSHSQNLHQAVTGRRAVLVCGLAALLIGAGPALIEFFYNQGAAAQ